MDVRPAPQVVAAAAVSEALSIHLQSFFSTAPADRDINVAIAGGSLVSTLANALTAALERGGTLPLERTNIWFVDERFVPHHSKDSNYKAFCDAVLIPPVSVLSSRTYAVQTDLPSVQEAAAEYAGRMRTVFGTERPVFDLILLGMGEDGHIASLFPGHDAQLGNVSDLVIAVEDSPKPPPLRISLTLGVINAANRVILVTTGSGKADAIAKLAHEHAGSGDLLPFQRVRQRGGEYPHILLDEAAASKL